MSASRFPTNPTTAMTETSTPSNQNLNAATSSKLPHSGGLDCGKKVVVASEVIVVLSSIALFFRQSDPSFSRFCQVTHSHSIVVCGSHFTAPSHGALNGVSIANCLALYLHKFVLFTRRSATFAVFCSFREPALCVPLSLSEEQLVVVSHKLGHGEVVFVPMTLPSRCRCHRLLAARARPRPMPMPATHRESAVDRSVCFCGTRQLALGVHCIFLLIHTLHIYTSIYGAGDRFGDYLCVDCANFPCVVV